MAHKRRDSRSSDPTEEPVNPYLRSTILEAVDTQLRQDTPPETRHTFERLLAAGYPEPEIRRMIGRALVHEIYAVMKHNELYNESRYIATLRRLPLEPEEQ